MSYHSNTPSPAPQPTPTPAPQPTPSPVPDPAPASSVMSGDDEVGTVAALNDNVELEDIQGSNGIYAYRAASYEEGSNYFPDFEYLYNNGGTPFSYIYVEKGETYRIHNNFSSWEGFSIALWFTDSIDAAYGLLPNYDETIWFPGDAYVAQQRTVDIEAKGRFLYASAFAWPPLEEPPQESQNVRGYYMKGSIQKVVPIEPEPVVNPEDLLMIQHETDDGPELFRISAQELKEYIAPKAVSEDIFQDQFGRPGLMYPGTGLTYNNVTGKVDAIIPARPRFVGIISENMNAIPPPYDKIDIEDPHPFNNVTVTNYPSGNEVEGDYYVVYDTDHTLTSAWGYSSGSHVFRGDVLMRVRHGDSSGDWEIAPSVNGSTSLMSILTHQKAISFDTSESIQFPALNIKTAAAAETETTVADDPDDVEGYDGLFSKEDKNTVNRLKIDFTEQDFTLYPHIE